MHQCEVEDAVEVWRTLSGWVDWSLGKRGESKETIKRKRVKDQRGKEEVGVSCRAQRTKGKHGGWWSRSKKRREWWMGAVAGEPHSLVERGKAKAENRKKKVWLSCLLWPCITGPQRWPLSPRGLWKDTSCLKLLQSVWCIWFGKRKIMTCLLALIFNFTFKGEDARLAGKFCRIHLSNWITSLNGGMTH